MEAAFYLIRHCEAAGQAPDAPLTERGWEQAKALADRLGRMRIQRIAASPFRRTVDSITPLAERCGLRVETDDRLVERVLSAENLPDWRERLEQTFADPDLRYPGGESSRQAAARGMAVVKGAVAAHARTPFALVSHGCLVTLILREFDPQVGFSTWESMTNPDVYRITVRRSRCLVERL